VILFAMVGLSGQLTTKLNSKMQRIGKLVVGNLLKINLLTTLNIILDGSVMTTKFSRGLESIMKVTMM